MSLSRKWNLRDVLCNHYSGHCALLFVSTFRVVSSVCSSERVESSIHLIEVSLLQECASLKARMG